MKVTTDLNARAWTDGSRWQPFSLSVSANVHAFDAYDWPLPIMIMISNGWMM
jgi:hypothetical protein